MDKLTHEQLLPMMQLQDELNAKINLNWKTANYPWLRAAWIESGELMDHIGWKWWKKQEPNWPQAHIELVDIWHFLMSEWIGNTPEDETMEASAHLLLEVMYSPEKWTPEQDAKLQGASDLHMLVDTFAHMCSANAFQVKIFERIMELSGLSWAMLRSMYVGKNVLNRFRQDNGYKDGTYIKTWNGEEDNVFLEGTMEKNPSISPSQLYDELRAAYATVYAHSLFKDSQ